MRARRPSATATEAEAQRAADLRILGRVAPYLWPPGALETRIRVVVALSFLVLAKVATVTTPLFFKDAVDSLSGDQAASEAATLALGAVALSVAYGLARLSSNGFQQLRDVVFAKVGQDALRRLARETFEHIHALSLRYHLERKTGALSRVIERGVKAIEFVLRFLLFSIAPLLLELLLIASILYVAFDWTFLAVVVGTMVAYIAFTVWVTEWRVRIRRRMNESDMEANQKAIDSLLNYETVKYFVAERREAERYDVSMQSYARAVIDTQTSLALLNFGQAMIVTAGLVGLMVMAALGVQEGRFTVGDFVLVNAYMIQIMLPLGFLGTVYRELRQSLIDMTDMFDLIDREVEVRDKPGAPALVFGAGAVAFDDVRFGYDAARPILDGVAFDAPGGSRLAIVGPSGAGKSTIARLLYRFYDVTGGAIRIDGQDLRDVTQASFRSGIGVVPQDTVLFNDTIGYNIAYARGDATREDVIAAADAAQLTPFIASLPDGFDTVVGERGLKLSGGEKQRVGVARAILKDPRLLILDEATSSLDTRTEAEIQDRLRELSSNRTVVAIAHRLSTIVDSDQIIVLEAGRVVERGPHAQLARADGLYAQMWARQSADAASPTAEPVSAK